MSVDYRCPYCGAEIEDPDYWEHQPETAYEVECWQCEKTFEVSYYLDPVFSVAQPEELEVCTGNETCNYWNIFDECCWFDHTKDGCHDMPTNDPCPLNHHGGEDELNAFERHEVLGIV